jgi:Beta/Gamma crystallin
MLRNRLTSTALVVSVIGIPSLGSAQEREMGGVGLTVYTDYNFRGKSATLREQVADFKNLGLNDVVSSLRVAPGEQWEICENANFKGRCITVSGEEVQLTPGNWGDIISSARRIATGVVVPPTTTSDWYVVLFDQRSYRGNPTNYKTPTALLGEYDNRAQSVTVGKGVWEFCDGARFTGRCVTLDKSSADLGTYGLLSNVSSLRPVTSAAPTAPSEWYVVLFDQRTYRGNPVNYKQEISNLRAQADRAQSVTIGNGVWELCDGADFTGRCVVLDKSVPDLGTYGLLNRVSSLRPVRQQQPR